MITVLVSGASGIVGYGVLRALQSSTVKTKTIGTTIYQNSIANELCDIFELAPLTNSQHYLPWLLSTIKKHKVNLIVPGIEDDFYFWFQHRNEIEQSGAKVLLNSSSLIEICQDKWLFYQELNQLNSQYVIASSLSQDYTELTEKFGSKLLLKPRRGFASKGVVVVKDRPSFDLHKSQIGEQLLVQPYVGSDEEEYTCAVFGDGQGNVLAQMQLQRTLSKEGYTQSAEVVDIPELTKALEVLTLSLKPIGPTNYQFRLHDQVPKLLEINPRISSSTSIRAKFGYNEAHMALQFFLLQQTVSQPVVKQGKAIRYVEDHIV